MPAKASELEGVAQKLGFEEILKQLDITEENFNQL